MWTTHVILGRFQDDFVESRRIALERCLQKIVAHPTLYGDPDLKVFLESESFNVEVSFFFSIYHKILIHQLETTKKS